MIKKSSVLFASFGMLSLSGCAKSDVKSAVVGDWQIVGQINSNGQFESKEDLITDFCQVYTEKTGQDLSKSLEVADNIIATTKTVFTEDNRIYKSVDGQVVQEGSYKIESDEIIVDGFGLNIIATFHDDQPQLYFPEGTGADLVLEKVK